MSVIGSLTTTYKGTIVVRNDAFTQSATVEFKDSSAWKSMTSRKGVKNGVSYPCDLGPKQSSATCVLVS